MRLKDRGGEWVVGTRPEKKGVKTPGAKKKKQAERIVLKTRNRKKLFGWSGKKVPRKPKKKSGGGGKPTKKKERGGPRETVGTPPPP